MHGSARLVAMDERAIKRLLVIVAMSLIAIWLFKSMMSKTIISLNKVAVEKKQAAVRLFAERQAATSASGAAMTVEEPAASAVGENAALESPAVPVTGETR
jgi:hypothetical protein